MSILPATSVALLIALGRWTILRRSKWVALAALLAYAMPIVPWFVVNAVTTGLPLSPFDVRIGHLALGAPPPEYRWYIDRGIEATFNWQRELRILKQAFAWPAKVVDAPGVLCLVPFLGMLPGFVRLGRRNAFAVGLLASVVVACLAFYFSHQFAPIRYTFPQNSGRFLLPAIAVATIATTVAARPRSKGALVCYGLLTICAAWYYVDFALVGFSATSNGRRAVVAAAAVLLVLGHFTNRPANATVRLTARLAIVVWRSSVSRRHAMVSGASCSTTTNRCTGSPVTLLGGCGGHHGRSGQHLRVAVLGALSRTKTTGSSIRSWGVVSRTKSSTCLQLGPAGSRTTTAASLTNPCSPAITGRGGCDSTSFSSLT